MAGSPTPVMLQHAAAKRAYPDAIVFFRMGDFYEMFGDDAVLGSKLLELTLTARNHATSTWAIARARESTALKPKAPTTCTKDGRSVSITVNKAGGFGADDVASAAPRDMSRSAKSRSRGLARFMAAIG